MDELICAKRLKQLVDIKSISSEFNKDKTIFTKVLNKCKELFPELFKICKVNQFDGGFYLIYKGKKHDKPILFMNHHDVVSVGDKWDTDPFNATLKDGKLYGRGTLDTKGGLYCMLEAANNLAKNKYVPNQDIYFYSDNGEETGGVGADYISSYFKEKGITFDYVLDEGGMIINEPVSFAKGNFAMVAVGEKAITEIRFTATSKGGHSSMPPKNSPLIKLSKFMLAVEKSRKFKKKINKANLLMLKSYSNKASGIIKVVLKHPRFFYPLLKVILNNGNDMMRALLRTTIVFTYAKASESYNVVPTNACVVANIRIAHHQGVDNALKVLEYYAKKYDLKMEIVNSAYNNVLTDPECEQFDYISHALNEVYNDVIATPFVSSAASDARYFSKCSKHVFGFVPFVVTNAQLKTVHGDNEYVDINNLPKAIKFYELLMRR